MNVQIAIFDEFGAFCADVQRAAELRHSRIEPFLDQADEVVLDFGGVRNMNSSFCNALIANLVSAHGQCVLEKLKFRNCRLLVQVMIESAIDMGLSQRETHLCVRPTQT